MLYDVFLICPVRNANEEQKKEMADYISSLEGQGKKVYYPARDTDQNDTTGFRICTDNSNALINSEEIHIYWDDKSLGSLFDLGMAFVLRKPLYIVNKNQVVKTDYKSFSNMILKWGEVSRNNILH